MQLLIEKGAIVEAQDRYGWSPISLAAMNGHKAVVQLLIEKGANIETKDKQGRTPLLLAAGNSHKGVSVGIRFVPRYCPWRTIVL